MQQNRGELREGLAGSDRQSADRLANEMLRNVLFAGSRCIVRVDEDIGVEKIRNGHADLRASICVRRP